MLYDFISSVLNTIVSHILCMFVIIHAGRQIKYLLLHFGWKESLRNAFEIFALPFIEYELRILVAANSRKCDYA